MSTRSTPPGSKPRLLCIPGAGASAARFERIRTRLDDLVDLRTHELPGRGIRFAESSLPTLTDHLSHFIERIEGEPYQRWILLGESLGAVTAAALARALADSMRAEVIGVITVAAAPRATGRRPSNEVVDLLRSESSRPGGPSAPIAVDMVLADIEAAHASHDRVTLEPVEVPVATIVGERDQLVTTEAARGWADLAPAGWSFREVPGTHYQFEQPSPQLIDAVRRAVMFIVTGQDQI